MLDADQVVADRFCMGLVFKLKVLMEVGTKEMGEGREALSPIDLLLILSDSGGIERDR